MEKDRLTRVNELLFRELGESLSSVLGRELPYLLTVTGVKCSVNLRSATVFVSVYGPTAKLPQYKQEALALLERKRARIQAMVASRIILKYTPILYFKLDETAEKADRVESILRELHLDETPAQPPENPAPEET